MGTQRAASSFVEINTGALSAEHTREGRRTPPLALEGGTFGQSSCGPSLQWQASPSLSPQPNSTSRISGASGDLEGEWDVSELTLH